MFKDKLRKPWFWVLGISLILNFFLLIRIENIYQARGEVKDCADWAWKQTDGQRLVVRDSDGEILYRYCMKTRYGIDK